MIHIRDLHVSYGEVLAIDGLSLDVDQGECVLVTGSSGCGKSTLARVLTGLVPHAIPANVQGEVLVDGNDISQIAIADLAQHVGLVLQNPASQLFHLHVEDELAFGPRNLGLGETQVQARVDWALEATGLEGLRHIAPSHLSAGQKQCVAIAAVLAMRPKLLVLDEPTASLDVPSTRLVMKTLAGLLREHAITIVLIEHRLAEALDIVDRSIVMDCGRIVADGPPSSVFADPQIREAFGLRRLPDQRLHSWDSLISMDPGHPPSGKPLLCLENITAGYNGRSVLNSIDLDLYPGELTALVGDNGAGKTTLALVAAGLLKPKGGAVSYRGEREPVPGLDVTLLFSNPSDQLFADSVDEEVGFGPRNLGRFDLDTHLRTLQEADLTDLRRRRPSMLSAGQQQRTALAACLALQARVLILDEPTLGQDWGHLERLMEVLRVLLVQGTAILLITHDFKIVHRCAGRAVLMEKGKIKLQGRINGNERWADERLAASPARGGKT